MNSQINPLLGIASPSFTPEPLRTITINATFEGEETTVYKEAVLMDTASSRDVLIYFPLRDGKYSSHTLLTSSIDDPDKNRAIMLYGSSPEDQAVVSKSLKITSDLNIMLDLSETGGGLVDYPLLTGIGKLSGYFDLQTLPESINYSDITIVANYRDPLEGTYNGLQAGKTTCNPDGRWSIEGLNEAHRYNVVMTIPTFNDITYSNKETSDSTYVPEGDLYWDKVVALLHFDGNLVDDKSKDLPWKYVGETIFVPGLFETALDCSINNTALVIQTDPFAFDEQLNMTLEGFFKSSGDSRQTIFQLENWVTGQGATSIFTVNNTLVIRCAREITGNPFTDITVPLVFPDGWLHIAVCFDAGSVRIYAGGEAIINSSLDPSKFFLDISRISVCGDHGDVSGGFISGRFFKGLVDEVRITKDVARYTENFTPPDKPFPNNFGVSN